jgi:hypothetical protein
MTGAAVSVDGITASDTILSVKQRVFALNPSMPVHRQRLVYRPGHFGISALANDETLGGAGVAQDGTAELDVLLRDLTKADVMALCPKVLYCWVTDLALGWLFCNIFKSASLHVISY